MKAGRTPREAGTGKDVCKNMHYWIILPYINNKLFEFPVGIILNIDEVDLSILICSEHEDL